MSIGLTIILGLILSDLNILFLCHSSMDIAEVIKGICSQHMAELDEAVYEDFSTIRKEELCRLLREEAKQKIMFLRILIVLIPIVVDAIVVDELELNQFIENNYGMDMKNLISTLYVTQDEESMEWIHYICVFDRIC